MGYGARGVEEGEVVEFAEFVGRIRGTRRVMSPEHNAQSDFTKSFPSRRLSDSVLCLFVVAASVANPK